MDEKIILMSVVRNRFNCTKFLHILRNPNLQQMPSKINDQNEEFAKSGV